MDSEEFSFQQETKLKETLQTYVTTCEKCLKEFDENLDEKAKTQIFKPLKLMINHLFVQTSLLVKMLASRSEAARDFKRKMEQKEAMLLYESSDQLEKIEKMDADIKTFTNLLIKLTSNVDYSVDDVSFKYANSEDIKGLLADWNYNNSHTERTRPTQESQDEIGTHNHSTQLKTSIPKLRNSSIIEINDEKGNLKILISPAESKDRKNEMLSEERQDSSQVDDYVIQKNNEPNFIQDKFESKGKTKLKQYVSRSLDGSQCKICLCENEQVFIENDQLEVQATLIPEVSPNNSNRNFQDICNWTERSESSPSQVNVRLQLCSKCNLVK